MRAAEVAAAAAPVIGPVVVTVFGTPIPILSLSLSVVGLLLARIIAPPPLRKLSRLQHIALTGLLLLILFLIVTGSLTGKPMDPGLAVMWGTGLGFSGLVAVELFAERVMAMMKAAFGIQGKRGPPEEKP